MSDNVLWLPMYRTPEEHTEAYERYDLIERKLNRIPRLSSVGCAHDLKPFALRLLNMLGYQMRRDAGPYIIIGALLKELLLTKKLLVHADGQLAKVLGGTNESTTSNRPCRDVNRVRSIHTEVSNGRRR